ncbi:SGNH/GDSL hydrolase family protein [Streptomyces sp. WAC05374]|uniref:SGNH/GDSL hydrolase family protein n=1 Tax=Streptomyces sp. WAC05374 TaxID=2487420 RepID=UPI000F85F58D|nr:SGNH/GDSL hydrolase family protein [Streptomyces sp. WAC05374]RST18802.1 SGNH/GDSL hydrolase family protein [Streptomyces sp. WAC05374]TDF43178.1 SGNH/GDSL hydrolase family protein [Streptomyces sp. WAC05374]TDF50964.1 SGNH/GDSL hydrolase family protein [Streptomyces sp. WAC05374]TDF52293.1 SGNH/GDSL hydrolase family protein [Streptomyces sp. WAC05374]
MNWTAAWTASPQLPSAGFTPNWSQEGFSGHTLRQIVRVTAAGDRVRVRLSNAYGTSPLHIAGATIALTDTGAALRPGSLRHLTFKGARSLVVPARGQAESDAAKLAVERLDRVTVTLHLAGTTGPATFHAQGFTDSHRAEGDHLDDVTGTPFTGTTASWYYLSGVDVSGADPAPGGVVLFGDSLTDGFGSTPNADRRWSDALAERVDRPVLNAGIGGNLLLNDSAWYGERASARFHRDALDLPGVTTVVLLQGLNDIGYSEARDQPTYKPAPVHSAAGLIAGYRRLIRAARARGVRIVGATILPFKGTTHWGPRAAGVAAEVNDWMRESGEFDAVVDLHRLMGDPSDPDRLNPAYAYEDGLHPDDAGYRVMAEAVLPVLQAGQ